jgi:hypothetical protein
LPFEGFETDWIPDRDQPGLSHLLEYHRNLTELRKLFLASVVDRFPNHTDFEFAQNFTDIIASPVEKQKPIKLISQEMIDEAEKRRKKNNSPIVPLTRSHEWPIT